MKNVENICRDLVAGLSEPTHPDHLLRSGSMLSSSSQQKKLDKVLLREIRKIIQEVGVSIKQIIAL